MSGILRAMVRPVPRSFANATVEHPAVIDTELAVSQHRRYVAALSTLVDQIVWAPAADDAPDSVFVEDQVVVCDGVALFTRSGCVSRRVEQPGIQHTLSPFVQGTHMSAPATLDGGDVLRVGQQLFVGRSGRTNDAGVSQLRDTFAPKGFEVHAIPVPSGLHLKCFCSALDADTVIVANGCLPEGCFSTVNTVVEIPKNEAYGANLLCRGRHVVMASDMPVTEGILRGLGYTVTSLSLSEIRKADGALTCMSVWF